MKYETKIDRDYNPDHDLCSDVDGTPVRVTWAEYELQQQIHHLKAMYDQQITSLNERINALERVNKHKLIRSATPRKDYWDLSQEEKDAIKRDPENAI